jgi:hypothetical protein
MARMIDLDYSFVQLSPARSNGAVNDLEPTPIPTTTAGLSSPRVAATIDHPRPVAEVVVAGILALAVAMGIGRFAFTPLLPLMMRDGLIDAAVGAELAAANYIGYLVGALSAAAFGRHPLRLLRAALAGVVVLTVLAAGTDSRWALWALRAAAGACSAWVLIGASSGCLRALAQADAAARGGWIYTGVGLGILGAGLLTWLGGGQSARSLWLELALMAGVGTGAVFWLLKDRADLPTATESAAAGPGAALPGASTGRRHGALVLCYGSFGFGYIVPATFLPMLARQQVDDPMVFGLAWPLFGLAAALSVAWAVHHFGHWSRRRVWAAAQAVMAVGTAIPVLDHRPLALVLSAILVGGTFMVATMAGLQLAREREPAAPTVLLARMTSAFAAGQIAGPLFVRSVNAWQPWGIDGLNAAGVFSTVLLLLTAAWLWRDGQAIR